MLLRRQTQVVAVAELVEHVGVRLDGQRQRRRRRSLRIALRIGHDDRNLVAALRNPVAARNRDPARLAVDDDPALQLLRKLAQREGYHIAHEAFGLLRLELAGLGHRRRGIAERRRVDRRNERNDLDRIDAAQGYGLAVAELVRHGQRELIRRVGRKRVALGQRNDARRRVDRKLVRGGRHRKNGIMHLVGRTQQFGYIAPESGADLRRTRIAGIGNTQRLAVHPDRHGVRIIRRPGLRGQAQHRFVDPRRNRTLVFEVDRNDAAARNLEILLALLLHERVAVERHGFVGRCHLRRRPGDPLLVVERLDQIRRHDDLFRSRGDHAHREGIGENMPAPRSQARHRETVGPQRKITAVGDRQESRLRIECETGHLVREGDPVERDGLDGEVRRRGAAVCRSNAPIGHAGTDVAHRLEVERNRARGLVLRAGPEARRTERDDEQQVV